ncbi:ATP-grasp domain-containing protein [Streptomyces liangshanensis]|uniref:ATP-grasp domain-containing protein n=1 Tax=Streptomyces liangshanensis TaxID=2717324 RepID=A0A6G9GVS9_9ACTN|nr:ATP-grasp domain-containing protein [Streptomyces liangshanensis]QIQ02325.1 ATP-grasp domain-containing protein [Streptomyces liangshanensis]
MLVMPGRRTSTMELLAAEAARRGMSVRAAEEPGLAGPAYWYGGPVAGARLAGRLGFALLEPADGWLGELSDEFTGRQVRVGTVAGAWAIDRPTFVKPPRDKSFPADVYADGSRLPSALDPATPVLLSDVVTFAAEYRLFLLDGHIATASRYAVFGRLDPRPLGTDRADRATTAQITEFADRLAAADPARVLDVVLRAGGP